MADLDNIIVNAVEDIWKIANCENDDSLYKEKVKTFVCSVNSHNECIADDFEKAFSLFGKRDTDTMGKQELIEFIKFISSCKRLGKQREHNPVALSTRS